MLRDELFDKAEKLEWSITDLREAGFLVDDDLDQYEFAKYSPAGEDFSFVISVEYDTEIPKAILDEYEDFDPEEHAVAWFEAGRGEPSSLRDLLDDADAIEEMIRELMDAMYEVLEQWEMRRLREIEQEDERWRSEQKTFITATTQEATCCTTKESQSEAPASAKRQRDVALI